MGRGRGRGRGGGGEEREDQYGGGFGSQDRQESFQGGRGGQGGAGGGGGFTGGGEAGGSKKGSQVSYVRQVPKFLQAHAHLLGKGAKGGLAAPEGATLDVDSDTEADFEHDDGGALQRAVASNPELAKQDPQLIKLANKGKAADIKAKGNAAFSAGRFPEAVDHFTSCIQLDPENEVFFSNRAAAYTSMKDYHKAMMDARRVIAIKPRWAKGHSRLAAAHFALQDYSEAKESYQRAVDLEPDDAHLLEALQRADVAERKEAEQKKHKFKRKDASVLQADKSTVKKQKQAPQSGLLSFDEDEA